MFIQTKFGDWRNLSCIGRIVRASDGRVKLYDLRGEYIADAHPSLKPADIFRVAGQVGPSVSTATSEREGV